MHYGYQFQTKIYGLMSVWVNFFKVHCEFKSSWVSSASIWRINLLSPLDSSTWLPRSPEGNDEHDQCCNCFNTINTKTCFYQCSQTQIRIWDLINRSNSGAIYLLQWNVTAAAPVWNIKMKLKQWKILGWLHCMGYVNEIHLIMPVFFPPKKVALW